MPRNKIQSEQIRAESREKILSAAQQLFAEQGYDGCSVSDVARQAGMSQGNIYWYFPSKEELFKAVLVTGFEALGKVLSDAAASPGTGLEKLDFFLEHFNILMKEQGGDQFATVVITLISQGGVKRMAELGLSTHQIGGGYHHYLNMIFAQGQAEGVFLPGTDPNLLSTLFFSFINGLMLMYPDQWKDIPSEFIRESILRLLGASSSK